MANVRNLRNKLHQAKKKFILTKIEKREKKNISQIINDLNPKSKTASTNCIKNNGHEFHNGNDISNEFSKHFANIAEKVNIDKQQANYENFNFKQTSIIYSVQKTIK